MKRLFPVSLKSFLATSTDWYEADCFIIQLPTGETIYATSGQWDITFRTDTPGWSGPQITFYSTQYGVWERGAITSEGDFSLSANTMTLTCTPQPDTTYPGLPLTLLAAAHQHLFDGATVWVYTAYMPIGGYGNVDAGIETKFQGTIINAPKLSRPFVQFDVADPLYLLNMKVPSRVLQSNCPHSFADVNCGLDPANFTQALTAAAGSTPYQIVATISQAAGYFTQGVLTCTAGANVGLSQTVKDHTSGLLVMTAPWILPVSPGDTFSAIKGCDKTPATCAATLRADGTAEPDDFRHRFGGQPFTPPPTAAI